MKQNLKIALTAAVWMLAAALAGCGNSAVTDEVIVEPGGTQPEASAAAAPSGTDIASQVQAPETWQTEFADEQAHIQVSVDAGVTVPDAEGFRLKDVTARAFEKEDYDAVNSALFGGAKLWEREVAQDDPANGFTKQEIEERIARLEEQKASGVEYNETNGEKKIDYDKAIEAFREMLKAAPDEATMKEVDTDAFFSGNYGTETGAFLSGELTSGDREYFISLSNDMKEDWMWVIFEGRLNGERYYPAGDYGLDQKPDRRTTDEDIIKTAQQAVASIGLTDFVSAGGDIYVTYREMDGVTPDNSVYGVHFTRIVDGIPVTYTSRTGTTVEKEDDFVWPYEDLRLAYDDEGLVNFSWTDPYVLADRSNEYVFLMPFEEIQNIFKEMVVKSYSHITNEGAEMAFQIRDIRLGYMRVLDRENPGRGTLIPVWDFFGSQTIKQPASTDNPSGEMQVIDGAYESWLTINAMDGTVINRDLGY